MIRNLTDNDIPQAIAMTQLRPVRGEDTPIDSQEILRLLGDSRNKTLGYFEGDKLVTWVMVRFGKLHEENIWCIVHMFTQNFSNHFNFDGPDFRPIIQNFFQIAEDSGHYSYIYSVPKKLERVYYKKWKFKEGRYDTSDIAFVPANTEPSENWIKRMNGGVRSYDIVIKKRTLKHEYRKNNCIVTD